MRRIVSLFAVLALLGLPGCAAGLGLTLIGAGGGAAASAGVNQTLGGVVYKTFANSGEDVRRATIEALDTMAMKIEKQYEVDNGVGIEAEAYERTIEIELERLTARTTRMRVSVDEDYSLFRDGATAAEIIVQTAKALEAGHQEPQRAEEP